SAVGLGKAKPEEFASKQILKPIQEVESSIEKWINDLYKKASERLLNSFKSDSGRVSLSRRILSLRFTGQETTLDVDYSSGDDIKQIFKELYIDQFGHWLEDRSIELESIRISVVLETDVLEGSGIIGRKSGRIDAQKMQVWFDGGYKNSVIAHAVDLEPNQKISGSSIIMDPYSTIVAEPGWEIEKKESGAILLSHRENSETDSLFEANEAVQLELFTNRFTSIAEQMGEILRRTALSVNVKDRLDFSCALLSPDGDLIVNAPHIPVHLGAMGTCVRSVMENIEMEPGDVVVTNHPAYGGSHLPDVTVITPVYSGKELLGFAANRAHHAEIGGKSPGSMPPDAKNLEEEGVIILPVYLIKSGKGQWDKIEKLLLGGNYPSRSSKENLADLRAAVAANQYGANALISTADLYGADTVRSYMRKIRLHSTRKMKQMLKTIPDGVYHTEELLDDGTPLKAAITITNSTITFDFTGTGPVQPGNLNATPAIVHSVVMYILRLLIDEDVPLNDGLFNPVKIILPECLLNPGFSENPADCPALVGGNTEISQRLTDTLLKPFEKIACSQGTMNNLLFGNEKFGYYETVGGGTGAGPGFHGADAVHHHMTNTRGTDPEIFEHKYPVRLNKYAIRKESGGDGEFRGGDGIIRDITFLEPVYLSVLTQHRVQKPYGLNGGETGKTGEQWVVRKTGEREKLLPVDGRKMEPGDRFILHTPGGGGCGLPKNHK
ncbi:MAG: hydantoinase B/oxoprolinase family protein, partial [Balneolaceae bacterium]|nr:hydantoinase B/oxoprolinase family protein [Balneolaceae bacterium]